MKNLSAIHWLDILHQIAEKVEKKVAYVLRSSDANTVIGRNLSGDLTRRIDLEAEKTILGELKRLQIPLCYVGEEISSTIGQDPEVFIITDCVDGTLNATRGIPFFCTSMAVSSSLNLRDVFAGLVMDLCRRDIFLATKNGGALLNSKPIQVSNIDEVSEAILRVSLSRLERAKAITLLDLLSRAQHDRHLGSAALELCYLAAGYYESFIDMRKRLRPTDIAAALLIIREAGGIVSFLDGEDLDCILDPRNHLSFIASCNRKLHEEILDTLNRN